MTLARERVAVLRRVLEERGELRWAYLFGSAAGGGPHRDVDVAVMPEDEGFGLLDQGRLVADLEEALGAKVDVVDLRAASLPFSGPMLAQRVVVLDRDREARHLWEADVTSRWIDFRPAYERYREVRLEAMRRRREARGA